MSKYPKKIFLPTPDFKVVTYDVLSVFDKREKDLYVRLKNTHTDQEIERVISDDWTKIGNNGIAFINEQDAKDHVLKFVEQEIETKKSQLVSLEKTKQSLIS